MALNNYLLQRVRKKDCLIALLPCNGGSVINPLKPGDVSPNSSDQGSWAERNGLITTENIIIKDNVFTAADPTKPAAIKTRLDMQQNSTAKTFIAQAVFHNLDSGPMRVSPLFNQGSYLMDSKFYVFNLNFRQIAATGYFNISYALSNNTKANTSYIVSGNFYDIPHTVAFVYDPIPDSGTASIKFYLDTILVNQRTIEHVPWNTLPPPYEAQTLGIREDFSAQYISDNQLAWAVIFDSALSAEEIVLFK